MGLYNWATCSKVIQAEVNTVLAELPRLLGQNLLGIYLHGSLALGGFQPARSDIDLIVATRQRLDLEARRASITFLLRVSKMPSPLDINFLAEQDMVPFQHPLLCDLHYSEAQREDYQLDLRNGGWKHWQNILRRDPMLTIQLAVLHQSGICLYGKPIADTLPPIPERDFRDAVVKDVQAALANPLHDPVSFVLNACRVSAYLSTGTILSKDAGGAWALANLPEQYHQLISQLLALYRGERPGRPVGHAALNDFAAYLHL